MSEAKACPTCGSDQRGIYGKKCRKQFQRHHSYDEWHDAPPQPAQPFSQHRENGVTQVQPATGDRFEEALREEHTIHRDRGTAVSTERCGFCVSLRATHREAVEWARGPAICGRHDGEVFAAIEAKGMPGVCDPRRRCRRRQGNG